MAKKDTEKQLAPTIPSIDESLLFTHVAKMIECRKRRAMTHANQEATMMFWEIGRYIHSIVLENERAAYARKILSALATKLTAQYGQGFAKRNLYRMAQFADSFPDQEVV